MNWLKIFFPWVTKIKNPNCELCEYGHVIKPGKYAFCLWGHKIKPFAHQESSQYLTSESGVCGDFEARKQ